MEKQRDSRGRFLPQLQSAQRSSGWGEFSGPYTIAETFRVPAQPEPKTQETPAGFFTSDLAELLEKPRNAPSPTIRRGVSYCASCGRIGGRCFPVVRDVEEAAISNGTNPRNRSLEFVASEARGEIPRGSWE